jgi:hypothetical protein
MQPNKPCSIVGGKIFRRKETGFVELERWFGHEGGTGGVGHSEGPLVRGSRPELLRLVFKVATVQRGYDAQLFYFRNKIP